VGGQKEFEPRTERRQVEMKARLLLLAAIAVLLMAGNTFAIPLNLGSNITIRDTPPAFTPSGEDNEVEPGCVQGQIWDLEGFFLDGTTLTMVGGFDFRDGQDDPYRPGVHYSTGAIFFDTDGDAVWGTDIAEPDPFTNASYHYNYAMDLKFEKDVNDVWSYKYDVYSLTNETLLQVYFGTNGESNPWALAPGQSLNLVASGTFLFYENLTDAEVAGLLSTWNGVAGTHYAVEVDVAWLGAADLDDFLAKYTYQCGNDNLIGKSIPDATTLSLLGSAMVIAALFGRRKRFVKE
jgi:hypothetical protein